MRPMAACARIVVERTRARQVTPESPGIPRAMVLRLIRDLPGVPGFLAPVALRNLGVSGPKGGHRHPQDVTPASGRQDHTISPSANASLASRHFGVHRIPIPTSVATRVRPLCGTGRAD